MEENPIFFCPPPISTVQTYGHIGISSHKAAGVGRVQIYVGDLVKERIDGSESVCLVPSDAMNLNISGEWIYYMNAVAGDYIYRVKKIEYRHRRSIGELR